MTLYNKVIWSEGMFLRPQHFQQQDRYFEDLLIRYSENLFSYVWGVRKLKIDQDLLKTGKFALTECSGILPDGTYFDAPEQADLPPPLDLTEKIENTTVYIVLPVRDGQGKDIAYEGTERHLIRYQLQEAQIADACSDTGLNADLQVGRLAPRLLLDSDERSGYHCIGVARIIQVTAETNVLFDENFIPSCLTYRVSDYLNSFMNELVGLLHQRGESLAGRISESGKGGAAEIADFLMLQAINRYEPLAIHFSRVPDLHPEIIFRTLIKMAGEFTTFIEATRRPIELPRYDHENLKETFEPVIHSLRRSLSRVVERLAVAIPIEERKFGIRVATIADKGLLEEAMFVLAVNADVPVNILHRNFPAMAKIGPVEKIRDLVNRALPGVGLSPLSVAPRQIPYHTGFTYFALDNKGKVWSELKNSGGLALHVGDSFPGLQLTLWAIRK
jgi:type VI secretion system protein ImpJ